MVKIYAITYRNIDNSTAITKIFDNKEKAQKLYNKIQDELIAYHLKYQNTGVSIAEETKNTLVVYCECEDFVYEGQYYYVKMITKEIKYDED